MKTKEDLRLDFYHETGDTWINTQSEPDIDYVEWLENKVLSELKSAKEPSDEDIENESKTSLSIDCRGIELPKEIRDLNLEILQKGFIIGAKAMRDGKIKTQTKLKG